MDNNTVQGTPSPFPQPTAKPAQNAISAAVAALEMEKGKALQPPVADMNGQTSPVTPVPLHYSVTPADGYFFGNHFAADVTAYGAYANRKTGYRNLDLIQPLYPGLYALGAISSLGKTTFVHQMADQIAAAGEYVLYFSLEQNRFELFSKSLARGFFRRHREETVRNNQQSTYPTPSSIDLRRGAGNAYPQELAEQIDAYSTAVGDRLNIVDGSFAVTVEDIVQLVDAIVANGVKPVVIVDYLQIIAPSVIQSGKSAYALDARQSIDHIVHTLKALQTKYNLTVIAISSVNRANYTVPIDFESFKESGGIEYTADVVWGLQLSVLQDEDFIKASKSIVKQREMIMDAKAETPRKIDFVCLKNRYGAASYNVGFDYYPASDIFYPCYIPSDPDSKY